MKIILVSACLVGINCRYDGSHICNDDLLEKLKSEVFIPVCPEQLGGLPTPRPRASIEKGTGKDIIRERSKVIDSNGKNVTAEFLKGAHEVLKIAKLLKVKTAVLKENSPSCGVEFTNADFKRTNGSGVCAAMLKREGIKILSENIF